MAEGTRKGRIVSTWEIDAGQNTSLSENIRSRPQDIRPFHQLAVCLADRSVDDLTARAAPLRCG